MNLEVHMHPDDTTPDNNPIPDGMKRCTKCARTLSVSMFYRDGKMRDGFRASCIECVAEQKRRYREANKVKVAEQKQRYYEANREKILEQGRRYYEENRDKAI